MKDKILPYLLKNKLEFGSINEKAVLGLVLKAHPELRKDVARTLKEISNLVKEVEPLKKEELEDKLSELSPELLKKEKQEIKGPLKPLKEAKQGAVVVRIAPSPSGALHIGHVYGASLNNEYAKMYQGKLILRIEDTNPENIYEPAYQMIEEDIKWLTQRDNIEVVVQSSRLETYYKYAKQLIKENYAYVCVCNQDKFREFKNDAQACPCRFQDPQENEDKFEQMQTTFRAGEAVLRLKTNIKDKNPAMRDFAIMRISEHIHPKCGDKYKVWPLMVLSVAIDDYELGLTHVLNGKDHTDNTLKEKMIMKMLVWQPPEYQHWGMINFIGMTLSSSKTKIAIEQNEFMGWDDIRLPFIPALRRRGYQPESFSKFALQIGLSLNDKKVTKEEFWKSINAFNKEIVEKKSDRYFFVADPQEIEIEWTPLNEIKIAKHSDFPDRGFRKFSVTNKFYISNEDKLKLEKGKIHRLMDCLNFIVEEGKFKFVSEDYEQFKQAENKGKIIHWLPKEANLVAVEVLMEDNTSLKGLGEPLMRELKEDSTIQCERNFFTRVDSVEKNLVKLWFLHK